MCVGLLFVWPLPLHLATHLTGPPTGDTGVYVWNMWVFQHELLDQHQSPLSTSSILSLDAKADLSQHNYTVFANLVALPLVPAIGLVASFNLIYIALTVLTAYGGFLLAKAIAGRAPEAWLAGLVFAWSPALVARGTGHFSLVAAAPLPVFVLLLLSAERTGKRKYMVAAGLTAAWAAYCDPYYAVYCFLFALLHVAARSISWSRAGTPPTRAHRTASRVLDGALLACALVTGTIAVTGGGTVTIGGLAISATGLDTPVLVMTVLVLLRLFLFWRPVPRLRVPPETWRLIRLAPYAAVTGLAALAPVVSSLLLRIADGRFTAPRIFWRTSTPGVDLLAFLVPNPSHPLAPEALRAWLTGLNGGFIENVASIPWVVLAVVGAAVIGIKWRAPGYWAGMALVFISLALGPFVRIAGMNTHVPTPWSVLRYVPIIDAARAPARFTALVMMAVAVLFALALTAFGRAYPRARRVMLCVVAVLLAAELWPVPRPLYSAAVPAVYAQIAADPAAVRVMELPFGIRDGLSSTGDFNASSQFYQAWHGKPLIGGYLSRVSARRIDQNLRRPVLRALVLLSQGQPVPDDLAVAAARRAPEFVRTSRLGYVVADRARTTPELLAFAVRVLDLEKIGEDDTCSLYRPRTGAGRVLAQSDAIK